MKDEATAAPTAKDVAERKPGITRANLPDPVDLDDKLETMIVCQALE